MMVARQPELRLHEEVLLLALHDEKGTVHMQAGMMSYAMAAGMLAELLLERRITITDDKKKFVEIEDERPIGDELLDECLDRIGNTVRRQRLQTWVSRFAQLKRLRHRVAVSLCDKGVLREDEGTILFIFKRKLYPERDHRYEKRVIERLRKAVFSDTLRVEPRTAVLVSLASASGLLSIPFGKRELRGRKKRIDRICEGEVLGQAARELVQAAQAAVMVATMGAATAASAASG
jgi:hypothetical protein